MKQLSEKAVRQIEDLIRELKVRPMLILNVFSLILSTADVRTHWALMFSTERLL